MHFIPGLSANLRSIESGVATLFSVEHNDLVLGRAPIMMFISADNPAHSDVCGIMWQTALYFCSKCYFLKLSYERT